MRTLVVLALIPLAIACKGKPKPQAAPTNVETATGSKPTAPRDVDLPHGPGTPPIKTTTPIDGTIVKRLAAMSFEGFVKDVRTNSDTSLWVLQQIPGHPVLRASVHVNTCNKDWPCWPIELATWQGHKDELMGYLTPELKADPGTVFEIGETDLHGAKMIYTYQLGQVNGDKSSAFSHAYCLYYNDGVNNIRVLSEYKDDLLKTKEDMVKALPRSDLENTSKAFMDVYSHAWQ